jgi:hypothetical protein
MAAHSPHRKGNYRKPRIAYVGMIFDNAIPKSRLQQATMFHFLVASQLQLALPVDVPFIRPPARRPFQYWVAIELVRVNEMLPPLIEPSVMVPTSCADVPAKLPLKRPREVSVRSNSPRQCPRVRLHLRCRLTILSRHRLAGLAEHAAGRPGLPQRLRSACQQQDGEKQGLRCCAAHRTYQFLVYSSSQR